MKIKRYTGSNAQEAMLKVKMDMGNDAIILHTRNIKQRGWFRFFSKPMVEILAAIDDEYGTRRTADAGKVPGRIQKPAVQMKSQTITQEDYPKDIEQINEIESKVNRLEAMIRRMYEHSQGAAGTGATKVPINKLQNITSAQADISKPAVHVPNPAVSAPRPAANISNPAAPAPRPAANISNPAAPAPRPAANISNPAAPVASPSAATLRPVETTDRLTSAQSHTEPKALEPLIKNLENQEVEKEIVNEIAKRVRDKLLLISQNNPLQGNNLQSLNQKVGASPSDVIRTLKQELEEMVGEPQPIRLKENGKPTVAIFLGPTGVGKTTTIAKIAANFALNKNKTVALITSDTYRIAAVDQLKTYAEILSIPVTVVYSADEMKPAIEENESADLILIDTAGISHKRKQQLDELKNVIESCGADEFYLVMSATASWKNCNDVIQNHQFIKDYKIIFTKLDEAPTMGLILNATYYSQKSLSYVTTGQSVPDDIDLVNVDKLTKNLLRSTAQ